MLVLTSVICSSLPRPLFRKKCRVRCCSSCVSHCQLLFLGRATNPGVPPPLMLSLCDSMETKHSERSSPSTTSLTIQATHSCPVYLCRPHPSPLTITHLTTVTPPPPIPFAHHSRSSYTIPHIHIHKHTVHTCIHTRTLRKPSQNNTFSPLREGWQCETSW